MAKIIFIRFPVIVNKIVDCGYCQEYKHHDEKNIYPELLWACYYLEWFMWQYFGLFEGKIVEDVCKIHILDVVKEEV